MKKPKRDDDLFERFKEAKDDYRSYYSDKVGLEDSFAKEKKEKMSMGRKPIGNWSGPSAEDRARFARERRAVEGSVITQKGFEGALVLEHIRGSQYLLRMPDGTEVFASHKKQRGETQSVSSTGWRLWEGRH